MKIFNSTVVRLDTQFWAVSNYVYQHWFQFLCKWNTVECITFIYFCHRCCNNDSRPDTAPGGGGKWASPNLQVWKKSRVSSTSRCDVTGGWPSRGCRSGGGCRPGRHGWPFTRLELVPYFPDMSGWTSGPIFSGEVRFFPDIDRGTSGGDFENYAEPTTRVFNVKYNWPEHRRSLR